jgi:hypothetical protein
MLYTFIVYNYCFFIAFCVVGFCPSVSSLLCCYCSPECFVPFYVFISVILFVRSVNFANALKCFFMSVSLFMGQLSVTDAGVRGSHHMLVKTALHKHATGKNRVTWR